MSNFSNHYLCYETLISKSSQNIIWPDLPENSAAGLCYTSGTTGNPKGAIFTSVYSTSRTYAFIKYGALSWSWYKFCQWYHCFMLRLGSSLWCAFNRNVIGFPGSNLDGASLFKLIDNERVNSAWGVLRYGLDFLRKFVSRIELLPIPKCCHRWFGGS